MTEEQHQSAQQQHQVAICVWCNTQHQTKCPLVKAIEYRRDGTIRQVTFFSHQELTATQQPYSYYVAPSFYGQPQ